MTAMTLRPYFGSGLGYDLPTKPPDCPAWCSGHWPPAEPGACIGHTRMWQGKEPVDPRDNICVWVDQVDVSDYCGGWSRQQATISLVATQRGEEFNLIDLTPQQAWAIASLVGDRCDEELACRILEAVETVAPELTKGDDE